MTKINENIIFQVTEGPRIFNCSFETENLDTCRLMSVIYDGFELDLPELRSHKMLYSNIHSTMHSYNKQYWYALKEEQRTAFNKLPDLADSFLKNINISERNRIINSAAKVMISLALLLTFMVSCTSSREQKTIYSTIQNS